MPRQDLIQIRRGTASEWQTVNPILDSGEFGFETDTKQIKCGDGSAAWNDLDYTGSPSSSSLPPVENKYANIFEMISDQGNQTTDFLNFVADATDDPDISSGSAYYRKKATSTATLADDYDRLTDSEATAIESGQGTETEDCGSVIPLDTIYGHNCNLQSANTNARFTLDNQNIVNSYARVLINVSQATLDTEGLTEIDITGATQQGGIPFVVATNLILLVWNEGDSGIKYQYQSLSVSSGSSGGGSLGNIVEIQTTDDPQAIFDATAAGSHIRFAEGEHLHGINNNSRTQDAILYVDKAMYIEIPAGAKLKLEDDAVPLSTVAEITTNQGTPQLNDLSIGASSNYTGTEPIDFYIDIDSVGSPDTFEWGIFNDEVYTPVATGVAITGGEQALQDGVTIQFGSTSGHAGSDLFFISYGAPAHYGIRVGEGTHTNYIEDVVIFGDGEIDLNVQNVMQRSTLVADISSCVLFHGRVRNSYVYDITMSNAHRTFMSYGERTGIYLDGGSVIGGESFDIENIRCEYTKSINTDPYGFGILLGHPQHRGIQSGVYCNYNYIKTEATALEPNYMLQNYECNHNTIDGTLRDHGVHLWRRSDDGVVHGNTIINSAGTVTPVVTEAPTGWTTAQNITESDNVNLSTGSLLSGNVAGKTITPVSSDAFIFRIVNAGNFTIPTDPSETYNYNVYDHEGNEIATGQTGDYTIVYGENEERFIQITGTFPKIYFNNAGDKNTITHVWQWGNPNWGNNQDNAFYNCVNLEYLASDMTWINTVTSARFMFTFCTQLNDTLPEGVTLAALQDGTQMFRSNGFRHLPSTLTLASLQTAVRFLEDTNISSIDSSITFANVTDADYMLKDTSITTLESTQQFPLCTGFREFARNTPLANINAPNFAPLGQDFNQAFRNLSSSELFLEGTIAFPSLNNGSNMFLDSVMTPETYNNLLSEMAANNTNTTITFHAGLGTNFTSAAQTDRDTLDVTRSWTITDGGITAGAGFIELSPSITNVTNEANSYGTTIDSQWTENGLTRGISTDVVYSGQYSLSATGGRFNNVNIRPVPPYFTLGTRYSFSFRVYSPEVTSYVTITSGFINFANGTNGTNKVLVSAVGGANEWVELVIEGEFDGNTPLIAFHTRDTDGDPVTAYLDSLSIQEL